MASSSIIIFVFIYTHIHTHTRAQKSESNALYPYLQVFGAYSGLGPCPWRGKMALTPFRSHWLLTALYLWVRSYEILFHPRWTVNWCGFCTSCTGDHTVEFMSSWMQHPCPVKKTLPHRSLCNPLLSRPFKIIGFSSGLPLPSRRGKEKHTEVVSLTLGCNLWLFSYTSHHYCSDVQEYAFRLQIFSQSQLGNLVFEQVDMNSPREPVSTERYPLREGGKEEKKKKEGNGGGTGKGRGEEMFATRQ